MNDMFCANFRTFKYVLLIYKMNTYLKSCQSNSNLHWFVQCRVTKMGEDLKRHLKHSKNPI